MQRRYREADESACLPRRIAGWPSTTPARHHRARRSKALVPTVPGAQPGTGIACVLAVGGMQFHRRRPGRRGSSVDAESACTCSGAGGIARCTAYLCPSTWSLACRCTIGDGTNASRFPGDWSLLTANSRETVARDMRPPRGSGDLARIGKVTADEQAIDASGRRGGALGGLCDRLWCAPESDDVDHGLRGVVADRQFHRDRQGFRGGESRHTRWSSSSRVPRICRPRWQMEPLRTCLPRATLGAWRWWPTRAPCRARRCRSRRTGSSWSPRPETPSI